MRAAVALLDNGEPIRTAEKSFHPASALHAFSKIYEQRIKDQLVLHLHLCLLKFIAAYRQQCNSQLPLVGMIEE